MLQDIFLNYHKDSGLMIYAFRKMYLCWNEIQAKGFCTPRIVPARIVPVRIRTFFLIECYLLWPNNSLIFFYNMTSTFHIFIDKLLHLEFLILIHSPYTYITCHAWNESRMWKICRGSKQNTNKNIYINSASRILYLKNLSWFSKIIFIVSNIVL